MSKYAVSAEGGAMPAMADEIENECRLRKIAAQRECDVLYSSWLAARAAYYDPDMPGDDDAFNERGRKCDAAALAFLVMPAARPWTIWRKWEVLEEIAASEVYEGHMPDNRLITALGCIKADILRFKFREPD